MLIPTSNASLEWDQGMCKIGSLLVNGGESLDNFLRLALTMVLASSSLREEDQSLYPQESHASCISDGKRLIVRPSKHEGTVEFTATGLNARGVNITEEALISEVEVRKWLGHL